MDENDKKPTAELLPKEDPKQGELFTLSEVVQLERERIASFDRRTDVAKAAIEAERQNNDNAYQFHMRQLEVSETKNVREHGFARKFLWAVFAVTTAAVALLIWMAFFGTPDQSRVAISVLVTLGKGLGGAGVFVLLKQAWARLFRS